MKILLVDGNSILNRAFFALPLLSSRDGIYTNAVLGFLNILFKELDEEQPDFLTVAFDVHAPTFRHEMYKEYKGTRKPMADELKMQLPIIREVLSSMNVNIVEMAGFEADDLLGTLAKKSESLGYEVKLLSGDRDLLQIATDKIEIIIPKTQKGKTENHRYFAKDVCEEYSVTPAEFIDVKALQGDTSDNIPGVPKVGEKTAQSLISSYHSLENLYEHVDEITKKVLHENLVNFKEQAYFSRTLATIEINAPIEPDFEKSVVTGLCNKNSEEVFRKYSLNGPLKKLEGYASEVSVSVLKPEYEIVEDFNETVNILSRLSSAKKIGLSECEKGLAIFIDEKCFFLSYYGFITREYLKKEVYRLLNKEASVYTISIKAVYDFIGEYRPEFQDAEILAYLIDPNKGSYPVTYLCDTYLSKYYGTEADFKDDPVALCALKAITAEELTNVLFKKIKECNEESLYENIEMPLSFVLYSMEKEGVLCDRETLRKFSLELTDRMTGIEASIYEAAGEKFNINSPKQLAEVLFEKLKIPGGKKTKSGYSTAADVLEGLKDKYPIVSDILEYRMLSKLKSTYAEGLQDCIGEDGRIHTHFNQTITATGRISSTDPNLQNIPIRTELGSRLREVFYPKEGYTFVDADYSQIELRLMAHMSGDETMIDAFNSGKDIHRSTAAIVFGKSFDEVTDLERRRAKAVNFGIIYGISAYGLSKDIGIEPKEADKYINDYFEKYPKIRLFLDKTIEDAKKNGYTLTLFNRRRPITDINSSNHMLKKASERIAMNAPIQGTAADIMKIAMINIFNRLKEEGLESKLLLQVHDEVLIECKLSEKETVMKLVKEEMEKAATLSVSLTAECKEGKNWYEAH